LDQKKTKLRNFFSPTQTFSGRFFAYQPIS
jgi:hypothetical protein